LIISIEFLIIVIEFLIILAKMFDRFNFKYLICIFLVESTKFTIYTI